MSIIHLSLVNKIRHSGKYTLSISTPFRHKYHFQAPKNKNPFASHDIKIQNEEGEKSTKNHLRRQIKKKRMQYKQCDLEDLQNMFEKEQNPEELNKIMCAIVDKQYVLSADNLSLIHI